MTPARREPRVVVLGGGSWGTTVASIAARRAETLQWVRSPETAEDISERHRNLRYLGGEVELTPSLKATTDFEKAADSADVVDGRAVAQLPRRAHRATRVPAALGADRLRQGPRAGRPGHSTLWILAPEVL